jgi:hypothetical protein
MQLEDILTLASSGRLYALIQAYNPSDHDPHWGALLDVAARHGRVSVVVWLVRLRALQGTPVDPVAVLPEDAHPRVREVLGEIAPPGNSLQGGVVVASTSLTH